MQQPVRRIIFAAAMTACCAPAVAQTFQPAEEMLWPDRGAFPAYPGEPADGRTIRYSVFSGLLHDNNLFRLSDSTNPVTAIGSSSRSDTIFRIGAGIDGNIPISRQNVLFTARLEQREYDRFDQLDHTAYRVGAAWNWRVGNDWNGDLGYQRDHYLASFGDILPVKDMITTDRIYGNAGYRIDARWRVRGGVDLWRYEHGAASQAGLDNRTQSYVIGADYVTPASNSVGIQFRYTEGNYQTIGAGGLDNDYKEYETSAVARWVVTGKSTFTGRVGYSSREHEQGPQRDFSGMTGRLDYDWFVANKVLLNFAAYRELGSYIDTNASYVVNNGVSFGPAWAPTEKLVFQARLVYEKRDYEGAALPALIGTPVRQDTFRGARFSAGWSPRRWLELVVSAERGDRDSNVPSLDFDYTSYLANARVRF